MTAKLLIYCPAMTRMRGGIERLVADILNANLPCLQDHTVHVVSHNRGDLSATIPVFELPSSVDVSALNFGLREDRIAELRRFLVDEGITHVVVMDASPVFAQFLLATEGLNVPILLSEHFEPSRSAMQLKDPSLREKILSLADGIHFLLPSYSASKPKSFNGRSFVIENSVGKPERLANVTVSNRNGRFSLINVARLHFWQKRQDVLVKAFARIADKHPMWDLKLWGDVHNKKDYDKLSNLVSDSGLTSRVFFGKSLGHSELLEEIQNSHLFVIPSDFEGSPISLAEALVHGLPAVGFSECPGVNEVIRHGYNGFLALGLGDPKSLSECLDILIRSTRLRSEFSANAATLSDVRAPSKIMSDWETLLAWFTSTKKPLRNSHPDAKRILLSTKQELLPD